MTTPFDLRVMGLLLEQGRRLEVLSGAMSALCGLWLVLVASGVAGAAPLHVTLACSLSAGLLAGMVQTWYGIRTAFDARLLAAVADAASAEAAAEMLDSALQSLGLIAGDQARRDWASRWRGARRLLRMQGLCVAVQMFALVFAVACVFANRAEAIT